VDHPLDRLPLFPLGLVLFPGAVVPLHIFEPRYRRLVRDLARDLDRGDGRGGRFGIVCGIPGVAERDLPRGRAGCVARLTDVRWLPDGRADILVTGGERFALERFLDDPAPYHVVAASPLPDVSSAVSPVALALTADDVAARFRRIAAAVHQINGDASPPPKLPDDPATLPWAIAAMIDLDLAERHALLAERDPAARLAKIDAVLRKALPELELRAAVEAGKRSTEDRET
jgi:Lon protease-like protein